MHDLAKELKIEERVHLYGFRKDIPRMLKAAGLPMITSDCRGTREYMEESITGRMCYNGTVEEYTEIIEWMINHEKERMQMSQNVRKRAQKFDMGQTERVMQEVYRTIPQRKEE